MSDPNVNNTTHVGLVVDRIRGIPPEKRAQKLGRTVVGIVFVGLGLKAGPALMGAGVNKEYVPMIVTVTIIFGAVLASFEYIILPLQMLLALARDAVNILVAFLTRKKANGDGEP